MTAIWEVELIVLIKSVRKNYDITRTKIVIGVCAVCKSKRARVKLNGSGLRSLASKVTENKQIYVLDHQRTL